MIIVWTGMMMAFSRTYSEKIIFNLYDNYNIYKKTFIVRHSLTVCLFIYFSVYYFNSIKILLQIDECNVINN